MTLKHRCCTNLLREKTINILICLFLQANLNVEYCIRCLAPTEGKGQVTLPNDWVIQEGFRTEGEGQVKYVFRRPIFQPRDWALPLAGTGGYATEDKIDPTIMEVMSYQIDNKMVTFDIDVLYRTTKILFHPQTITVGSNDFPTIQDADITQVTISNPLIMFILIYEWFGP